MLEGASVGKLGRGERENRAGDFRSFRARIPDTRGVLHGLKLIIGIRGGCAWVINQCRGFSVSKQLDLVVRQQFCSIFASRFEVPTLTIRHSLLYVLLQTWWKGGALYLVNSGASSEIQRKTTFLT